MDDRRTPSTVRQTQAKFDVLLEKILRQIESDLRNTHLLKSLPKNAPCALARADRRDFTYVLVRVPTKRYNTLTMRQRQITLLVGQGLPNKAIGRRLNISSATVAAHLRQVYYKLHVTTRTELARFCVLLN